MTDTLDMIIGVLESIDNDPQQSMRFFTTAVATTNITNKPVDNCRYLLIYNILYRFYLGISQSDETAQDKTVEILNRINDKYQQNQQFCWKSHEHHFHETFESYINCPITCLWEVVEYLQKLRSQLYAIRS